MSSHGVPNALWAAGRVAAAVLASVSDARQGFTAYLAALAAGRQRYLVERHTHYWREQRFADAAFWRRRHLVVPPNEPETR